MPVTAENVLSGAYALSSSGSKRSSRRSAPSDYDETLLDGASGFVSATRASMTVSSIES